jgi:uracil-DNA glycosylase
MEFFSAAEARAVRPLPTLVPRCDQCGLKDHPGCRTPKMKVDGAGKHRILVVAEYPGGEEDAAGRPLVGRSGRLAAEEFERAGLDLRRDCWLTNAQICYDAGHRAPATAVADCRPNLLRALAELKPEVVLLMGGAAIVSLLGHLWKADVGKVRRWTGWSIPARPPLNAWVLPTYNPAYLLRRGDDAVLWAEFRDHLAAAARLRGRPWTAPPVDAVETILSPDEAAVRLRRFRSGRAAFDYETTTLKPDGPHAEIVCASVCWEGRETFSFPWAGPVIPAFREFLENGEIAKIGYSMKFEDRWSLVHAGVRVRGWLWDGMLAAHALDPRRGVTGLKFQSFVRLGVPDYNSHVEPFLDSGRENGCNAPNRIWQVGLPALLKYCALDSLYEFQVAESQMKEMGYDG